MQLTVGHSWAGDPRLYTKLAEFLPHLPFVMDCKLEAAVNPFLPRLFLVTGFYRWNRKLVRRGSVKVAGDLVVGTQIGTCCEVSLSCFQWWVWYGLRRRVLLH